jgi:pyrroline-5-carboxylate reductase
MSDGYMSEELTLAFIGGGNMANALAAGLIGKRCAAAGVHVVDPTADTRARWEEQGVSTAAQPTEQLGDKAIWVFAVKPQVMRQAVAQCKPFLRPGTLVVSIAAGIRGDTIAGWLGAPGKPHSRLVRCMPNTPALIGEGVTGLVASPGVSADDKAAAEQLLKTVGQVVWVQTDEALDAVTALSGSGPAYVFLFLEALIEGARKLGLDADQARTLALATLQGATQLAALSPEPPARLRERVTSKGGTTAAALGVFADRDFSAIVGSAMRAAHDRAAEMAREFDQ